MQQRYYDPVIGRFYSNDPVGTSEHLKGTNGPHGFNRYAYANNNPYKFIDPDGRSSYNPQGMSINMQGVGKLPDNSSAMNSALANSMNENGGMRAAQMTAGAVAIAACNAACGAVAVGIAAVSIADGVTGKSVVAEGLQAAGTSEPVAQGVAAVADLAGGGKGFIDDIAGAAKALATESAGSAMSKAAIATGNTALTQANLDSNLSKVEDAVKK